MKKSKQKHFFIFSALIVLLSLAFLLSACGEKKVMIEGLGFMYVAKEVGVLAGMALLLIGASVVKIKVRL